MRFRAITDDIAEAPDFIHSTHVLDFTEHCSKGGQVSMDIGNNGISHTKIIYQLFKDTTSIFVMGQNIYELYEIYAEI